MYSGTLVHATEDDPLQILPNYYVGIEDGKVNYLSFVLYFIYL